MKENSLDSHRGKVAESKAVAAAAIRSESTASTNFDDDYNEWELGIGDLIIDLDADIEKNNEKGNTNPGNNSATTTTVTTTTTNNNNNNSSSNSTSPNATATANNNQLHHHLHHHHQTANFAMSSGKTKLNNSTSGGGGGGGSVEHQATVDKGLKMKIKRTKPTKTSEAKHEIVKPNSPLEGINGTTVSAATANPVANVAAVVPVGGAAPVATVAPSSAPATEAGKSKHASSKGRGGSHREKKERTKDKERDKERSSGGSTGKAAAPTQSIDVNGVLGSTNCSVATPNTVKLANNSTINVDSLPTPKVSLQALVNIGPLNSNVGNGGAASGNNPSSTNSGITSAPSTAVTSATTASSVGSSSSGANVSGVGSAAAGLGCSTSSNNGSSGAAPPCVGGGSAPCAAVASVATAAVTPPSTLSVKLEPKFPNVPISNFAAIKTEDTFRGIPNKRMRISGDKNSTDEQVEPSSSPQPLEMHDVCVGTSVGTITEPECLGPCEPGTTVTLEGIVWQETEGGVLVVNVTWRGKTYVGTLLDCTKHDWAPPRFCESPTSDVESRTPKGRGKRGRGGATTATIDPSNFTETRSSMHSKLRNAGKGRRTNNSGFTAPPSPAKVTESSPLAGVKRKGRPAELELPSPTEPKAGKRSRSQPRGTPTNSAPIEQPSSPVLIECPEPNCSKKYKHINGLRYHQTHAHQANPNHVTGVEDSPDEQTMKDASSENDESTQEGGLQSPGVTSSSSSSEKALRSSPRPFTGKVPPPPFTSDQKPAVPTAATNGGSAPTTPLNIVTDVESPMDCSTDLGTLASVAISDSKMTITKVAAGVLRYGQSTNGSSPSPVGSQCQSENSATLSPHGGTTNKVPSPTSSIMPVITSARAASPVPASAAPPALSPSPHQSPRHAAASVPISQQQPLPPALAAHIYHHHNQFPHPSNAPLIAECPPGSNVVIPSQPAALAPVGSGVRATGTPNGPVSHPLSPSIMCGGASAAGPTSPHGTSDKTKVKQEKPDKYRVKSMAASPASLPRTMTPPSVAAPSPSSSNSSKSSLAASTPPLLAMQQSNLGAIPSLPISASLKPHQPKQNLLGEVSATNPLLDVIKKEKSKHRKKNKDRDRERKNCMAYGASVQRTDLGSSHSSGLDAQDKLNGSLYGKMTDLLGKDGVSRLSGSSSNSDMPLDLNTSSADNGSTCNENVQSPAYSDISDANDSSPPSMDTEVSGKDKEDKVKVSAEQSPTAAHNLAPYQVYGYYGQSPYVVSPMPTQSPPVARSNGSAERSIKEEVVTVEKVEEKSAKEVPKHWSDRGRPSTITTNSERMDGQERIPSNGGQMVPVSSHASQEYHLHQQKLIQQQYAYSYNYSYQYMEQAYHMQMKASESPYKHHHHHQHQQLHSHHHQYISNEEKDSRLALAYKEQSDRQKEAVANSSRERMSIKELDKMDKNLNSIPSDLAKQVAFGSSQSMSAISKERDSHQQHHSQRSSSSSSSSSSHSLQQQSSSASSSHQSGSKVEAHSASLKEKQNENHQILKENIELKAQMDKKSNYDRYDNPHNMYAHSHRNEELKRYLMYQQDKSDNAKGPEDLHRKDEGSSGSKHGDSKAQGSSKESPKPSAVLPPTSHASSSSRAVSSPKTSAVVGGSKESAGGKDLSGIKKDGDGGSKVGDPGAPVDGNKDKKESRVQEGQKPTMETQGPPPPTNSYAYMHPAYMQSPHYGPLAFDPTVYRGMNPMMMTPTGHYPGSPYLHPQMRYHVPQPANDPQNDLSPKMHQTKALDLLQHHASQYYTSHKIHELQEHAIKSPGGASSQAVTMSSTKLTESTASISKGDPMCPSNHDRRSPPLQRHLHTHHHTHVGVGVGYPILRPYEPYGAIIVSQQTVAVAAAASSGMMLSFPAK